MADKFKSARLIYRAIEDADEDFVHTIEANPEAHMNSTSSLHVPQSKKASKKHLEYLQNEALLAVIVCLPEAEKDEKPTPVGVLSLRGVSPKQRHHRASDISIDIAEAYQGKGYGTEAIEWVLKWGFQTAGLHRIGIEAFTYNPGALRLYERLGFTKEGTQRECLFHEGAWHGYVTFGMLEHEWRGRQFP